MPWQALIEIAAAANAFLLAIVLILSPRLHRTRARVRLAGFMFCVGWLLTTFTLIDQQWLAYSRPLQLIDDTLALLLSALFLDYLLGSLDRGPLSPWGYAPATVYFFAGVIGGGTVLDAIRIEHVIAVQFVYTVVATVVFAHAQKDYAKKPHHLTFLLGSLWVLHAAQFTRLLWPSVGWVFDTVPLVGAAFVLTLTVLVLTDSRALKNYTKTFSSTTDADAVSLKAIDDFMRTEKPYLDPKLNLETLAQGLSMSARALSTQINRATGQNFHDFVNRHRIEESQRLLCDPNEARTSVEAIGLMVGFRARSTFYESFRRVTNETPAEYRRERQT